MEKNKTCLGIANSEFNQAISDLESLCHQLTRQESGLVRRITGKVAGKAGENYFKIVQGQLDVLTTNYNLVLNAAFLLDHEKRRGAISSMKDAFTSALNKLYPTESSRTESKDWHWWVYHNLDCFIRYATEELEGLAKEKN